MSDPATGIGSKLSGLSAGLILGTFVGGLKGFLVGAGGVTITSALTGLAGGGFIGNKIGSLAGMLIGASVGLIAGLLEALVKRDSTCIGSRIKDGVSIGENWLGKAGSLAGSLLGVIAGGVFGFKIAIYAGGVVGALKGLNDGVKRAGLGFKEGFMAGFTGESQPLSPMLKQQPSVEKKQQVEKALSTPGPLVQSTARVPLDVSPYLNILKNLGILPLIINQIELRLENPVLKRLMNYVLTEYIFPLLRSPVNQSAAVQPSSDNNDNKENTLPENSSIFDPKIPASSTSKSLGSLRSNFSVSPSVVAQPVNNSAGKHLFEPVTSKIVAKPLSPSTPATPEKKNSSIDNSNSNKGLP